MPLLQEEEQEEIFSRIKNDCGNNIKCIMENHLCDSSQCPLSNDCLDSLKE